MNHMLRKLFAAGLTGAALLAPLHSANASWFGFGQDAPQISETLVVKVEPPECGADYDKVASYLSQVEGVKSVWVSESKRHVVMEVDQYTPVNTDAVDLVISRSGIEIKESKFSHRDLAYWKFRASPVLPH